MEHLQSIKHFKCTMSSNVINSFIPMCCWFYKHLYDSKERKLSKLFQNTSISTHTFQELIIAKVYLSSSLLSGNTNHMALPSDYMRAVTAFMSQGPGHKVVDWCFCANVEKAPFLISCTPVLTTTAGQYTLGWISLFKYLLVGHISLQYNWGYCAKQQIQKSLWDSKENTKSFYGYSTRGFHWARITEVVS